MIKRIEVILNAGVEKVHLLKTSSLITGLNSIVDGLICPTSKFFIMKFLMVNSLSHISILRMDLVSIVKTVILMHLLSESLKLNIILYLSVMILVE